MSTLPKGDWSKVFEGVDYVDCANCHAQHDPHGETYFYIVGNILVGERGGVIGNHIDDDGHVYRMTAYCRTPKCFDSFVKYLRETIRVTEVDPTRRILAAREHFTEEQLEQRITDEIVDDAKESFGTIVYEQLKRDQSVHFKFWDSASMIEQGIPKLNQLLDTYINSKAFVAWVFATLNYIPKKHENSEVNGV